MRQNNAEHEHESRSISNTSKDLKRAQARINKAVIVQKLSIFDKHRVRLMSESDTIRSRALKISSTTKKENRRSSRRSLKAEMKDLLRHHARVEFD
jgi:seryl-tRNA synthetase